MFFRQVFFLLVDLRLINIRLHTVKGMKRYMYLLMLTYLYCKLEVEGKSLGFKQRSNKTPYISCNPQTLKRNIDYLTKHYYKV